MPIPESLFDPTLIPFGWVDPELSPLGWFDSELASSSSVTIEGIFPTGATNGYTDSLEASFNYLSGSSGPGTINLIFRGSGDTSYGVSLTCKDSGGVDLSFKACSFHIRFGKDGAQRVVLSAVIYGEMSPSNWWSNDIASGGATFTRFA